MSGNLRLEVCCGFTSQLNPDFVSVNDCCPLTRLSDGGLQLQDR